VRVAHGGGLSSCRRRPTAAVDNSGHNRNWQAQLISARCVSKRTEPARRVAGVDSMKQNCLSVFSKLLGGVLNERC
jgi:hypothetical protein